MYKNPQGQRTSLCILVNTVTKIRNAMTYSLKRYHATGTANNLICNWSAAAGTAECFLLRQETYEFSKSEELA